MRWLWELLYPPAQWARHCQEEDAKCREWWAKEMQEYYKRQAEWQLALFHKPSIFKGIINGRNNNKDI